MQIPRLHPDTIDEVKQRVDIVDIISDQVILRKQGRNLIGLCPFHQEKTPSFSVSPDEGVYYCFGCTAGGDGIKFLMEIGKQSFQEVILELGKRYQVPIKTLETGHSVEFIKKLNLKDSLYEIMAVAMNYYQHILKQEQGQAALKYVLETRKLSIETVENFQLGYAPSGWDNLYRYLVESKRYQPKLIEQAGLAKSRKSGDGYYDIFRERLIIPIKDTQGRVVAFGSRSLNGEEPKYLNSPDTPIFDKSKILFALDKAKKTITQKDQAIIVEGYFDAITLHSVGISNTVAVMGTAFNQDQVNQLLRYSQSKQLIFNFDADKAGVAATQRAIKEIESLIFAGQIQVKILHLPSGKDADDFLRDTPDGLQAYLSNAQKAPLWLDWQISQLTNGKNLGQSEDFQQVSQSMVGMINKIENAELQTYYIEKCANILANNKDRLIPNYIQNLIGQIKQTNGTYKAQQISQNLSFKVDSEHSLLERAEYFLLLIYLHCPDYRQNVRESLEFKEMAFTLAHHRALWQAILDIEQDSYLNQNLQESLQDYYFTKLEEFKLVAHIFTLTEKNKQDLHRIPDLIEQSIVALEQTHLEKYRQLCLEKWKSLGNDQQNISQFYMQEFYQTQEKISHLVKRSIAINSNN